MAGLFDRLRKNGEDGQGGVAESHYAAASGGPEAGAASGGPEAGLDAAASGGPEAGAEGPVAGQGTGGGGGAQAPCRARRTLASTR